METQKIINFLNDLSNEEPNSQIAKGKHNQNNYIKFETESIKSSLCDYSDAFTLVARDITVTSGNNTDVAFKNCAPFSTCKTEVNNVMKQIIFALQFLCTI